MTFFVTSLCRIWTRDVMRVRIPRNRGGAGAKRRIGSVPRAVAEVIACVHRLAIAAETYHCHISAGRRCRSDVYASLAIIVRVSGFIRRARNTGRAARRRYRNREATTVTNSSGSNDGGSDWEEAVVAMIYHDRAAFGVAGWRWEVNDSSRVVILIDGVRRGRDVFWASHTASARAAATSVTHALGSS